MSDPDSDSDPNDPPDRQHAPRQVHCRTCGVTYRSTHYHCCLCRRVFKSASGFERHQLAAESPGHPASDAQLRRLGLTINTTGVWVGRGAFTREGKEGRESTATNAPREGKAPPTPASRSQSASAPKTAPDPHSHPKVAARRSTASTRRHTIAPARGKRGAA